MIPDAARMRRWMLRGAPLIGLFSLGMRAGGGAAGMLLWLCLGIFSLPRGRYPYPRKRSGQPGRLFFAFSAGTMLCALPAAVMLYFLPDFWQFPILYPFLLQFGSACFACALCSRLLAASIPKGICWRMGGVQLLLSFVFIAYTQ